MLFQVQVMTEIMKLAHTKQPMNVEPKTRQTNEQFRCNGPTLMAEPACLACQKRRKH